MEIPFHKYEGAGNDFILIDHRDKKLKLSTRQIALICDRRFGVGGDGLILLEIGGSEQDFKMIYFNSDGRESTFCGNGGRCIAHFAHFVLKIAGEKMTFQAMDGVHQAQVKGHEMISLSMLPVNKISFEEDYTELDTGSPHYVKRVANLENYPVFEQGRSIRNLSRYMPNGINVNFLETKNGENYLRTYERGVEDETFACGTGVTAAAIAFVGKQTGAFSIPMVTKAGHHFTVSFEKESPNSAQNIILTGPVNCSFRGYYFLER